MPAYKLYEIVALARDVPGTTLRAGQTGTVVEYLADGAYEVEFTDAFGCTLESRGFVADELTPVPAAGKSTAPETLTAHP